MEGAQQLGGRERNELGRLTRQEAHKGREEHGSVANDAFLRYRTTESGDADVASALARATKAVSDIAAEEVDSGDLVREKVMKELQKILPSDGGVSGRIACGK